MDSLDFKDLRVSSSGLSTSTLKAKVVNPVGALHGITHGLYLSDDIYPLLERCHMGRIPLSDEAPDPTDDIDDPYLEDTDFDGDYEELDFDDERDSFDYTDDEDDLDDPMEDEQDYGQDEEDDL